MVGILLGILCFRLHDVWAFMVSVGMWNVICNLGSMGIPISTTDVRSPSGWIHTMEYRGGERNRGLR